MNQELGRHIDKMQSGERPHWCLGTKKDLSLKDTLQKMAMATVIFPLIEKHNGNWNPLVSRWHPHLLSYWKSLQLQHCLGSSVGKKLSKNEILKESSWNHLRCRFRECKGAIKVWHADPSVILAKTEHTYDKPNMVRVVMQNHKWQTTNPRGSEARFNIYTNTPDKQITRNKGGWQDRPPLSLLHRNNVELCKM